MCAAPIEKKLVGGEDSEQHATMEGFSAAVSGRVPGAGLGFSWEHRGIEGIFSTSESQNKCRLRVAAPSLASTTRLEAAFILCPRPLNKSKNIGSGKMRTVIVENDHPF